MLGLKDLFGGSANREKEDALLRQALSAKTATVISARCCSAGAAAQDEVLEATVKAALKDSALDWNIVTITITQAQSSVGRIGASLSPVQAGLIQEIQGLFMSNGLSIFPALILDQKLLCYGGVPSMDQLKARLEQAQVAA